MLLTIDVGNTHTVFGIFDREKLVADWRMATHPERTEDEYWLAVKGMCDQAGIDASRLDGVGIASVVPDITGVFESMARKYPKVEPVTVSTALDLGFNVHYEAPSAVGADRLCNAIAGFKKYGGPLIVIDFGTATTYDVISAEGDYLGGVIALGLSSAAGELHRRAAKLPRVELRFPLRVVGRNTVESMQAGVMFGAVDAVEGTVRRIQKELGVKARVIATGGLADIVVRHTPIVEATEPALVLDGIRLIHERQSARRGRQ